MRALRVLAPDQKAQLMDMTASELSPGEVLIQSAYSSLNFKDALAVTNRGKILKAFPLNPGIDVAGHVLKDSTGRFQEGDPVLFTGCGLGEDIDGGFGEQVRVPAKHTIPLPSGMDLERAMFFGTAGFTAALAVHRLLHNHQTPQMGPILVTGATGGVGSFSVALLSHLNFEVWALTGKKSSNADYLKSLGANQVVTKEELQLGSRPLEKTKFGGAIDNLGGETLAQVLAHVGLWGNVASIGLAESATVSTTVMPFILRGVSLLGASSNNCTLDLRKDIWKKLDTTWNAENFQKIHTKTVHLEDVPQLAQSMMDRKTTGRILVKHRRNT